MTKQTSIKRFFHFCFGETSFIVAVEYVFVVNWLVCGVTIPTPSSSYIPCFKGTLQSPLKVFHCVGIGARSLTVISSSSLTAHVFGPPAPRECWRSQFTTNCLLCNHSLSQKKTINVVKLFFHDFAARDSLQMTVNIGISLFSVSGDYFVCDIVSVVYHLKCLFIPRCCLIANKWLDQAWLISRAILIMIVIGKFSIVNACALWER